MPSRLTSIVPSANERAAGAFDDETLALAARCLRVDGALIVEDAIDVRLISEARRVFFERYASYLDGSAHEDALTVGENRSMITVELEPPFDDPQLFANPWLVSILSAVLDPNFVIDSFGVVCSLPSAPAQHRHRDGEPLFPAGLDALLPTTAITLGIPLLEMNEQNGTTGILPGSHRDLKASKSEQEIQPIVREGSAVLWDFQVLHGGTANRGAALRPLLYVTCCRPWFVDHRNFARPGQRQMPLVASEASFSKLSEEHKQRLTRATVVRGGGRRPPATG
jgi:ectoine hydroxylase-related dioxygenase (phytanoyl-CoA dioxygenase family)